MHSLLLSGLFPTQVPDCISTCFFFPLKKKIYIYIFLPTFRSSNFFKTSLFWPVVSSSLPQGDMWLFAKCKDNHWAINEHQKGAISSASTRDNCRSYDEGWGEAGEAGNSEINTKLVFKLQHANAMSWDAEFIALWGVILGSVAASIYLLKGNSCGRLFKPWCQLLLGFCLTLVPKIRKVKCFFFFLLQLATHKKIIKS